MKNAESSQSEKMKTITLWDEDSGEPVVSLLRGHHSLEVFNKAFMEEGWEGDEFTQDQLHHEFWFEDLDEDLWIKSEEGKPGAEPVTVAYT